MVLGNSILSSHAYSEYDGGEVKNGYRNNPSTKRKVFPQQKVITPHRSHRSLRSRSFHRLRIRIVCGDDNYYNNFFKQLNIIWNIQRYALLSKHGIELRRAD